MNMLPAARLCAAALSAIQPEFKHVASNVADPNRISQPAQYDLYACHSSVSNPMMLQDHRMFKSIRKFIWNMLSP
jgi:hypothetical protein